MKRNENDIYKTSPSIVVYIYEKPKHKISSRRKRANTRKKKNKLGTCCSSRGEKNWDGDER
jgi:hypothetical protein